MQPARWYAFLVGKLKDSEAALAVARQDLGDLCRGKLFTMNYSVIHPDSLSQPAVLNRMHPYERLPYKELTPAGQDILHMWTWLFLSFNRVPVSKRQALLESVEMSKNVQLLLPRGN